MTVMITDTKGQELYEIVQKSYQDLLLENAELRAENVKLEKEFKELSVKTVNQSYRILELCDKLKALTEPNDSFDFNSNTRFSDGEEGEENP